jgi:hypothetical protein
MEDQQRPAVGARVRLVHDVERYPHFVALAGATGVVVDVGDPNLYAVRLDEPLAGAEEWSNEVHWILDTGDVPDGELELVEPTSADFVNRDAIRSASDDELRGIVDEGGPAAVVDAAALELRRRREGSS